MINTMVCEKCTNILANFKRMCKNCNFVRRYRDRWGNVYFVRQELFTKKFAIFMICSKQQKQIKYDKLAEYFSFAEAQSELNSKARQNKWRIYEDVLPTRWSEDV